MKRSKFLMVLLMGILLLATTATAFAATVQEQREETRHKVAETLNKLYERKPSARTALKNAEGYAVFVNTGIKLGILGDSHGRGLAHNNKTGEEIFMRMKEFQAGLGLGIKEYALIFAFIDKTAWDRFISSKVSFGGQADVTADDGVNGGSFEGEGDVAVDGAEGVEVNGGMYKVAVANGADANVGVVECVDMFPMVLGCAGEDAGLEHT